MISNKQILIKHRVIWDPKEPFSPCVSSTSMEGSIENRGWRVCFTRTSYAVLFPYHLGTSLTAAHDSKSRSRGWSSSADATASRTLPSAGVILPTRSSWRLVQEDRFLRVSTGSRFRSDNRSLTWTDKPTHTRGRTVRGPIAAVAGW